MSNPTPSDRAQQRAMLVEAREALNRSHLGLGPAIDRVLEALTPWLLLGDVQERPRVLGLWGMTGTGKSSLVRQLVQHLGLDDRTFWLDAGECRRSHWLENQLDMLRKHHDGTPFILVVDEFQHARTIKGGVEQDEPADLRRLWELMDAGRAVLDPGYRRFEDLLDLHDELHALLEEGVVVKNGKVVHGLPIYERIMAEYFGRHQDMEHWALPPSTWSWLRDMLPDMTSVPALQRRLERMDGPQVLRLLADTVREQQTPHVLDGRKALVIVLGNLDPLYVMGREPLPELDPDVLLERHARLGTNGVQQALLSLFRIEQVARLGTDHVIFPPMGRETMRALVRQEAGRLGERFFEKLGVPVRIGDAVLDRLHREAAIAVLGVRPVIEAVQQVIPGLLSQVLMHPWADGAQAVHLDLVDGRPLATLRVEEEQRTMLLRWPGARLVPKTTTPEQVQRHAVHESGHLLCGMRLMGRTPLQACARTSNEQIGGFVVWTEHEAPITGAAILPYLALQLGGWAAERAVYGAEGVSAGSRDDLRKASEFALDMVKTHGLGPDRRFHAEHPEAPGTGFRTGRYSLEATAHQWLEEAEQLALRTLQEERALLDELASALAEAGSLDRAALEGIVGRKAISDHNRPIRELATS